MFYENIIIGAGASGLMCGIFASSKGKSTLIIERNKISGKKMLLTGGGRCNLTNNKELDDFMDNIPKNSKFCYSFLSNFKPSDIIQFFNKNNLILKEEDNNRMFPITDKSIDVVKFLENMNLKNGTEFRYNSFVKNIYEYDGKKYVVLDDDIEFVCNNLVIATGGCTYKRTGSDGNMYKILESLNHSITKILPSEMALKSSDEVFKIIKLQGISLSDIEVKVVSDNKVISSKKGDFLFTHNGVSGPVVLKSSFFVVSKIDENKEVHLEINFLNISKDEFILKLRENTQKTLKNALKIYFCDKMIDIAEFYIKKVDFEQKIGSVSNNDLNSIYELFVKFIVNIDRNINLDTAIVTNGGVDVKEINPKTLESKIMKNLYFVGEVMDINASTGGYNLTLAFASGKKVGEIIS